MLSAPPFLGAHVSIAGGLDRAFERIRLLDGTALQLFTRNQRQWKVPPLTEEVLRDFQAARDQWGDYPICAHDSYLINMASPDTDKAARSTQAFAMELSRVEQLRIPYLVTHPGSHLKQGVEQGITTYVRNLDSALEDSGTEQAMVLLETTSGQGTNLGSSFEELAAIIAGSNHPERLGVCLDTCHVFCAGYDLRIAEVLEQTLEQFDTAIGLDRLHFLHLNDSKHELGSRKDRHEHIGQGHIGEHAFRLIVNHPALHRLPMILETPKDKDPDDDLRNLALVRGIQRS